MDLRLNLAARLEVDACRTSLPILPHLEQGVIARSRMGWDGDILVDGGDDDETSGKSHRFKKLTLAQFLQLPFEVICLDDNDTKRYGRRWEWNGRRSAFR
jgi:hypothetical protein